MYTLIVLSSSSRRRLLIGASSWASYCAASAPSTSRRRWPQPIRSPPPSTRSADPSRPVQSASGGWSDDECTKDSLTIAIQVVINHKPRSHIRVSRNRNNKSKCSRNHSMQKQNPSLDDSTSEQTFCRTLSMTRSRAACSWQECNWPPSGTAWLSA